MSAAPPLERLDRGWTRLELGLCVAVVAALVSSLLLWVALKGLASKTTDTFLAGYVFRAASLSLLLGAASFRLTKRPGVGWLLALAGVGLAWPLRNSGVEYFGNIFAWLQDGSILTWFGGLRGLGTRLTLWLALLGASLATASGRHVTIDVVTRALGDGFRLPLTRLGGVVAALVCAISAWGFFDFIAVDAFGVPSQAGAARKAGLVLDGLERHALHAGRQFVIDLHVLPRVLAAKPWDRTVTGADWNEWLGGAQDNAAQKERDLTLTRAPLLSFAGEASRGLLVKDFGLILPFGLLMMALRFALWLLRGAPVESAHGAAEGGAT